MAAEEIAFPLLPGSHGPCLVDEQAYPRFFTFADGCSTPLFTSGVLPAKEIERIAELTAARISAHYGGQRLLVVQVLEGARTFAEMVLPHLGRLQKAKGLCFEVGALQVRSYGQGSQASVQRIVRPLQDHLGRDLQDCAAFDGVVLIDDLIDGGQTMVWLVQEYLPRFAAKDLGVCVMLKKDRRRNRGVDDVLSGCLLSSGKLVPDEWLVGYGLDLALPGAGASPGLHLFRPPLPGGIYAFNSSIEKRLAAEYQSSPQRVREQLRVYLSSD